MTSKEPPSRLQIAAALITHRYDVRATATQLGTSRRRVRTVGRALRRAMASRTRRDPRAMLLVVGESLAILNLMASIWAFARQDLLVCTFTGAIAVLLTGLSVGIAPSLRAAAQRRSRRPVNRPTRKQNR
ncbi:hypothetical protein [Microbacterium sp. 13-71-7]|jgi:hypothetical protein|uniref:hypothetical protein n=1 Tax=Microbacterium sp. 13-71-7 TaxID=1970399 RepID=UPI000BD9777F|nr:hypothetical protein [Microbacterium sp. 13-71-7]OZB83762.1 MAG: hypothetical protein B7X32_09365 [Microbacterium sp. 13-71-7]